MKRIFPDYTYGDQPRAGCWWDETCELPETPILDQDLTCDIAVIGAGFTGLNAALELASQGADVVVLDAETPGWGASGRNGGFCCLGGGMLEDSALDKRFGKPGRLEWRATERAAIEHVRGFLERTNTDADVHSEGETWLAHRQSELKGIEQHAAAIEENYGVSPAVHSAEAFRDGGLSAGFHGAMTVPLGFALNCQ